MPKTKVSPLIIILSTLGVLEIVISQLYPHLSSLWERLPVLFIIVAIPAAIIATFIYLLVKKPGHLYPPSDFAAAKSDKALGMLFAAFHDMNNLLAPISMYKELTPHEPKHLEEIQVLMQKLQDATQRAISEGHELRRLIREQAINDEGKK